VGSSAIEGDIIFREGEGDGSFFVVSQVCSVGGERSRYLGR